MPRLPLHALPRRSAAGFTLLEMLVVLLIVGLLTAVVALAPSRNRRSGLAEEAQRLATLLESAGDEAQVRSSEIAWEPGGGGYRFYLRDDGGKWRPMNDVPFQGRHWGGDVTAVSIRYSGSGKTLSRIVFGEESIAPEVTITLFSGAAHLNVISTGIGNFVVRQP